MKKLFTKTLAILAMLAMTISANAKQYCGEVMTLSGSAEIKLSCIKVSDGNYQIIIEGENLNGLGGSFYNPGAKDLRTAITTSTSTKIVCDIAAESAPNVYTPLYVLCPGEQNVGWPNDIEWGECGSGDAKTASELSINATEKTLDATNSETFQIVATTAQGYDGTVTYASSKDGIATVDASGLVTAAGRGTATITVTAPETENFAASTKKLTVTVTGPINWEGVDWLAGSDNKYKVVVDPDIPAQFGGMSKQGDDLYIGFPSAAFGEMSIEPSDGAGAWKKFALSNFPAKENQFTVVCDNKTYTFDVYYADGTEGGESGGGESEGDIESEYCGYEGNETKSGNTYVTLTWETQENGDVLITMGTGTGATSCSFRNGGFEGGIGAFVVSTDNFETTTPASNYFTATQVYSGNTYRLVKTADLPDNAKIKHVGSGHAFSWTVNGNSAYTYPDFIYTYGGVCDASVFTDIKLSASAKIAKVGDEVTLDVKAVDQNGMPMDGIDIDLAVSPADMGSIEGNVFTFAKTGVATITASSAEIETSITLYGVPSDNLALNQPCEGGYYDNNEAESFDKANDGNTNTAWVTYADQPATKEWWYVDLGDKYTLAGIDVLWGEPASNSYILQVRDEAPTDEQKADDAEWETLLTVNEAGNNSEQFNVVTGAGRYVRLRSLTKTANFLRLKEVRVFGTEYVPSGDTEAPVMGTAELVSNTWNSAVIAVTATDNEAVTKYHVVDATNEIDVKLIPAEGKITVTGLTAAKAYAFTITALDAALNESENSEIVKVITDNYITAPTAAAEAPTWPAAQVKAIYSPTYDADCNFANWGGCVGYTQEEYGKKYEIGACGFFGVEGFNLNCILMEKLHYDIWIADNATIRIVPIWGGTEQGITVNLKGQQWNCVDIALEQYTGITDWSNIYQIKIDQASNLTFWVGNAYFYRESELVDDVKPTNVTAEKSLESYFSVKLTVSADDNSGAVLYVVKDGETEVGSGAGASGANVNITINNLTPNTEYNFNVIAKDEKGNEADPVAVSAKTLVVPGAAPAPSAVASNVKSLYSNTYENATNVTNYCENWWLAPNLTQCVLGEDNNTLLYENIQSTSSFGIGFAKMNIEGFQKVHISIYPINASTLIVLPIVDGVNGKTSTTLVANEWNEVVFDYTDATISADITQLGFREIGALGAFFLDNVYFFKEEGGSAVENTESGNVQSAKVIENGVLYIVRDGVRYNIMGAKVK